LLDVNDGALARSFLLYEIPVCKVPVEVTMKVISKRESRSNTDLPHFLFSFWILLRYSGMFFSMLACTLATVEAGNFAGPIQHIVLLMEENRAFDHMFGFFPGVNGLTGKEVRYLLLSKQEPIFESAMSTDQPTKHI
jgi:hypothetical protein